MAEDVGDYCRVVPPELGQFLSNERPDSDVLKADGVNHAASRLAHPGRGRPGHGLDREALYDDPAQPIQIYEVRKLDAVPKRAAGGNNRIFEMKGADSDSEVNPRWPLG